MATCGVIATRSPRWPTSASSSVAGDTLDQQLHIFRFRQGARRRFKRTCRNRL